MENLSKKCRQTKTLEFDSFSIIALNVQLFYKGSETVKDLFSMSKTFEYRSFENIIAFQYRF